MPAVPLNRVLALANPLRNWPWGCPRPSEAELQSLLLSAPLEDAPVRTDDPASRHIGRIRFLAQEGWSDAIELDVGVPVLGYPGPEWPVTDGNHRLAAASLRNDQTILIDVAGQLDHAANRLRVPEALLLDGRQPA